MPNSMPIMQQAPIVWPFGLPPRGANGLGCPQFDHGNVGFWMATAPMSNKLEGGNGLSGPPPAFGVTPNALPQMQVKKKGHLKMTCPNTSTPLQILAKCTAPSKGQSRLNPQKWPGHGLPFAIGVGQRCQLITALQAGGCKSIVRSDCSSQ